MENYILIAIILIIVGLAAFYVIRAKKKGAKCIGCPHSSCPSKNKNSGCGCGCQTAKKD